MRQILKLYIQFSLVLVLKYLNKLGPTSAQVTNKNRDRAYLHYTICPHDVYRNNFTTKVLNQVLQ